jgi:FtsH-binding integral membrane protein
MQQNQSFDREFSVDTDVFAAAAAADERAGFIMKTYSYLFGAIAALIVLEIFLFTVLGFDNVMAISRVMYGSPISLLLVFGAFIFVSKIADSWAMNATSSAMQHAGLGLYIVAEAFILLPLLCIAQLVSGDTSIIVSAATAAAGLFAMLTLVVFVTRKDFSFLRAGLGFCSLAAFGLIITAILFQFALGPIFMYSMIAVMCGYILYYTSNVLHHYRIGQHVAASLALFACIATLFWYILQLFLISRE